MFCNEINEPKMNTERAKSLLAAYDLKAANTAKAKPRPDSTSQEIRIVLILMVFDHRPAEWGYDFMVEQDILTRETDRKKRKNQIRKISGWCSKIRVEEMGLPPLHRGLIQPPDMLVARERWDVLNPRPSDEILLSGTLKFTPADYSDLDLGPSQHRKKLKEKGTKSIKSATSAKPAPTLQSAAPATIANPEGASSACENPQEGEDRESTPVPGFTQTPMPVIAPAQSRTADDILDDIWRVPMGDTQAWESEVLRLKCERFRLCNARDPDMLDKSDLAKGLKNTWREAIKRAKARESVT
jgi:hypothetical protein